MNKTHHGDADVNTWKFWLKRSTEIFFQNYIQHKNIKECTKIGEDMAWELKIKQTGRAQEIKKIIT